VIDIAAEKARLEKALAAAQKEAKALEGRLATRVRRTAKPEAVEKPAPITRTTAPRPSGWPLRWRGWGDVMPAPFVSSKPRPSARWFSTSLEPNGGWNCGRWPAPC
jgi:hypothetical protein